VVQPIASCLGRNRVDDHGDSYTEQHIQLLRTSSPRHVRARCRARGGRSRPPRRSSDQRAEAVARGDSKASGLVLVLAAPRTTGQTGVRGAYTPRLVPHSAASRSDVSRDRRRAGDGPRLLSFGTGTGPLDAQQEAVVDTMDESAGTVLPAHRRRAAEAQRGGGHGRDGALGTEALVEGDEARATSKGGLGQSARYDRSGRVHRALVLADKVERARQQDVHYCLEQATSERCNETFSGRFGVSRREVPGRGQATRGYAAALDQEERSQL